MKTVSDIFPKRCRMQGLRGWCTFVICIQISSLLAQASFQRVEGLVRDAVSYEAIPGAHIQIKSAEVEMVVVTDSSGTFLTELHPGRYMLHCSFTGYQSNRQELWVISGKALQLQISLVEISTELDQVVVVSSPLPAVSGSFSVSTEKTSRIPANFFDPVRMATSYPGIQAVNDQSNSIMVRGGSPDGLLWRLNGLDIVNPNHLSNAGTFSDKPVANGGGVNIISGQLLERTDFYTGTFPVRYGNALSGISDMYFRDGNKTNHEQTVQASLLGLDLAAEGPMRKNRSSYLANYRYSTVGLLSQMGIDLGDEIINFQDGTFNLNFTHPRRGDLSVFGIFGRSTNEFRAKDMAEREVEKDWYDIDYKGQTYAIGLHYDKSFSETTGFSSGISFSTTDQERAEDFMDTTSSYETGRYRQSKDLVSLAFSVNKKMSRSSLEMGMDINYHSEELYNRTLSLREIIEQDTASSQYVVEGTLTGTRLQPYMGLVTFLSSNIQVKAGLRYMLFTFKESKSVEPRLAITYLGKHFNIELGYGLVSQLQLPVAYFGQNNEGLGFTRSHRLNFSHEIQRERWSVRSEIYYTELFDVPVETIASSYSVLNHLDEYVPDNLTNQGSGKNYGVSAVAEKVFTDGFFAIVGGSFFSSAYRGSDNVERDTRFNGIYTVNLTGGKEWKAKRETIGLNTRFLLAGGMREAPIDIAASEASYSTVYDYSNGFSNSLSDYVRMDLRISFQRDKNGYTRTLALDIQNVWSQQNEAYHYYDFTNQEVLTKYQLGIIPVLVYRIDF